jgi:hypothetical protein
VPVSARPCRCGSAEVWAAAYPGQCACHCPGSYDVSLTHFRQLFTSSIIELQCATDLWPACTRCFAQQTRATMPTAGIDSVLANLKAKQINPSPVSVNYMALRIARRVHAHTSTVAPSIPLDAVHRWFPDTFTVAPKHRPKLCNFAPQPIKIKLTAVLAGCKPMPILNGVSTEDAVHSPFRSLPGDHQAQAVHIEVVPRFRNTSGHAPRPPEHGAERSGCSVSRGALQASW